MFTAYSPVSHALLRLTRQAMGSIELISEGGADLVAESSWGVLVLLPSKFAAFLQRLRANHHHLPISNSYRK